MKTHHPMDSLPIRVMSLVYISKMSGYMSELLKFTYQVYLMNMYLNIPNMIITITLLQFDL